MARRRVRSMEQWRQPLLPGMAEQFDRHGRHRLADAGVAPASVASGAMPAGDAAGADWEAPCFREACRYACRLATVALAALEVESHERRPSGYVVEGWRERTLVTRFGDVRVRRRLYRVPGGTAHFLLDERLGWLPGQVATPAFATLLVDWATDVPFRTAARRVGEATAGAVSGSTAWRLLQQVAKRVTAHEQATHATWAETAALPAPEGERVVPVLYLEADGVWVKTQREPTHRTGYELKCASMYEGWEWRSGATPGHPRPHYRLQEKQVYCHAHTRADARAPIPFCDGVSLALSRTYDLSQIPVVVVGGDGANWIDTALESFPQTQVVRQRDGFHLARDAGRSWGPETGATLYQEVRAGNRRAATALLALPAPQRAVALLPPLLPPPPASVTRPTTGVVPGGRTASGTWAAAQIQRARATFTGQVNTPDAAMDWRLQVGQVSPELVPAGARGLGTQEGTNAHVLAKRMKHKGMAWRATGARAMAKARELVTNGGQPTLTPWCHRPAPATPPSPRHPGGCTGAGPLPWPQASCSTAHGPFADPIAATLHRIDTGARSPHQLT